MAGARGVAGACADDQVEDGAAALPHRRRRISTALHHPKCHYLGPCLCLCGTPDLLEHLKGATDLPVWRLRYLFAVGIVTYVWGSSCGSSAWLITTSNLTKNNTLGPSGCEGTRYHSGG